MRRATRTTRFATSLAIVATSVLSYPLVVLAASPSPTGPGGDTRSGGEGPGLVGEPLGAIALVIAIALVSMVATLAYVRLTARRRGSRLPRD